MTASELEIQRALTKAFIATAPVTLALQPRNRVETPTGGWVWQDAVPRDPQVLRICTTSSGLSEVPHSVVGQDGVERKVEAILLGEWDAQMELNDTFEYQGKTWVLDQLYVFNGWEQRAAVTRHG